MSTLKRLRTKLFGPEIPSFSLCEALEAEFEALHGPLGYEPPRDSSKRMRALMDAIHKLPSPRTALCLSGGGIRSATFALGLLQGLARWGLLSKFDYLSTVSGGGYVGSWLSAWIARHPEGAAGVERDLASPTTSFLDPEPEPVRHLREYSNYLTPKMGLTSADTWAVIATVLRNLLLNWLLLIPMISLALLLPRWYLAFLRGTASPTTAYVTIVLAILCAAIGMAHVAADLPGIGDRRKSQIVFLYRCLLPLFVSTLLAAAFWYSLARRSQSGSGRYLVTGAALLLTGLFIGSRFRRRRHRSEPKVKWRTTTVIIAAATAGAFGGLGVWILTHHVFQTPQAMLAGYVTLAPASLLLLFCAVGTLFVGLTSRVSTDQDLEWWSRSGGWFLLASIAWLIVTTIVIYGPEIPALLKPIAVAAGGVSGITTAVLGYSGKTMANPDPARNQTRNPRNLILSIAAPLFVVILLGLVSALTTSFLTTLLGRTTIPFDLGVIATAEPAALALLTAGLAILAFLMGWFVNVNKFSLHAMYRNRLIRAYLGASHLDRDPNPFTGFDHADDIDMGKLPPDRPFHVLNLTLNLVDDHRLAWQQRKAETFTVSRLHSGSSRLQYRPSDIYGKGMTLGTATAISGAAASPNMGYHSSPPITFLMTLFNARLGWWLGSPADAGAATWKAAGPGFAPRPLLSEALGLTNDANRYVYLSDGGHFENLGLYEMILRRCHLVLVSDAGCDPTYTFADLADAVRKVRIDLGIPITFDEFRIGPPGSPRNVFCALGTMHYDCIDIDAPDGYLIYVKPTLTGAEPRDVAAYHAEHRFFPHEATSDQWFDEAQFESYRSLGAHSLTQLCANNSVTSFADLLQRVSEYLRV